MHTQQDQGEGETGPLRDIVQSQRITTSSGMKTMPRFSALLAYYVLAGACTAQADVSGSISGFCSIDGAITPIDAELIEPEVVILECLTAGVPYTAGLASVQLLTAGTDCEDLDADIEVVGVTTSEQLLDWGITRAAGLTPPFPVQPCPPVMIANYGRLKGSQDAYAASVGSLFHDGPIVTKTFAAVMTWSDTLEITSDGPQTIGLPVRISGSVFAGESLGTSANRGYAKLEMTGTVAGTTIDEMIEVESVSTIPEQASINVASLVQIPLVAGSNVIDVDITGRAEVLVTAQGAGLVAGSATAGVTYSDTISIGRFVAADGGELPPGLLIRSTESEIVYEDTTSGDCPADLSGDGVLDITDVLAFLVAFGNMEPAADFADPPGTFDISDVLAFLTAFGAGCP